MKWYMALNEEGTRGDIALHTKIAVLSARRHTQLEPKLLYVGQRNEFTDWLGRYDVEVIDQRLPYIDVIDSLVSQGRYTTATLGHWLRTSVCLVETCDTYVCYTDVDVMFQHEPSIASVRPNYFSAAPEFERDSWNYFNAGVMVQNVEGLRSDYSAFESYLRSNIAAKTYDFHDQIAYNTFYHGRWDQLDPGLNWKPYWGANPAAEIIHFHGPKIGAIEALVAGRWNWDTDHGRQIGSIFLEFLPSYKFYVGQFLHEVAALAEAEIDRLHDLNAALSSFTNDGSRATSLDFMRFKMF
jgi:hypothetical protein